VIRPAEPRDVGALVAMFREIFGEHARRYPDDFAPDLADQDVESLMSRLVDADGNIVLIAERDGRVVGYAWAEMREEIQGRFSRSPRLGYLHHLHVDPSCRRSGLGSALLATIEERLRCAGIAVLELETWSYNAEARGFFDRHGLTPKSETRKKLISTED